MNAYRQLFDDAIGAGEPPTIDVAGIISKQRRRARLRTTAGVGLTVLAVVGVVTVLPNQLRSDSTTPSIRPAASAAAQTPADVLHAAAVAAMQGPTEAPPPEQFLFTESVSVGPHRWNAPALLATTLRRDWISVSGVGDGVVWEREKVGDGAWKPTFLHGEPLPGCHPPNGEYCPPSSLYRTDLPTDPDAMLSYLTGEHSRTPSQVEAPSRAVELLDTFILPAEVRAAVFEAMAKMTGFAIDPDVVLLAGCRGIAVGRPTPDAYKAVGAREPALLFDPETYALIGSTEIQPGKPHDGQGSCVRTALVDKAGQLP